MFGLFKEKGYIGYYKLNNWWKTLNKNEKDAITDAFYSNTFFEGELLKDTIPQQKHSASFFLSVISEMIEKENLYLSLNVIEKAISLLEEKNYVDKHYCYTQVIKLLCLENTTENKNEIFNYCKKLILLSEYSIPALKSEFLFPLSHIGYEKIYNLYMQNQKPEEARKLLLKAKSEGWLIDVKV